MKVKQLQWKVNSNTEVYYTDDDIREMLLMVRPDWDADLGRVRWVGLFMHGYLNAHNKPTKIGTFDTVDEAKQACQTYFEMYVKDKFFE